MATNLFRKVLATVDLGDTESSVRVVHAALEVITDGDTLHVVCVVPDYGMSVVGSFFPADHEQQAIAKAKEELHAFTGKHVPEGIPVQHIIAHGNVYEEILEAAATVSADLIVVGSHRPELKDYLLGPNAARVVRHSKRSVLVVRGE
ncbi:MAG: universal stress protein [Rhizobiaceae bacterium]